MSLHMINIKYGLSLHRGSKVRYKRHIGVITKSDWRDYAYIKIEGKTYDLANGKAHGARYSERL